MTLFLTGCINLGLYLIILSLIYIPWNLELIFVWKEFEVLDVFFPPTLFSSIGMVKAALEACRGFNFFGKDGASWSVTYVDPDSSNRNKTTLESLLPRESSSKVIANLSFFFLVTRNVKMSDTIKWNTMDKVMCERKYVEYWLRSYHYKTMCTVQRQIKAVLWMDLA